MYLNRTARQTEKLVNRQFGNFSITRLFLRLENNEVEQEVFKEHGVLENEQNYRNKQVRNISK